MKTIMAFFILFFSISSFSQSVEREDNCIYDITGIDLKPEPQDGLETLNSYLTDVTRKVATRLPKEGKIFALFVVEKDGSLSDVKIIGKVEAKTAEELVKTLISLPKWRPGKYKGKIVRVLYPLVLDFH